MSLITLRNNLKKQNNFISDCFNFLYLGKFEVSLHFTETKYSVVTRNFLWQQESNNCLSTRGVFYYDFLTPIEALNHFHIIIFSLISDMHFNSYSEYQDYFDFNRFQGWNEWHPLLHHYLK